MNVWLIVFLSVLGTVAIMIPICQLIVIASLKVKSEKSEAFLMKNLRYIVYVTGQVRAGKTTFSAGYTNIRTKNLIKKAKERIEFTCLAFPDIPFNQADGILRADFKTGEIDTHKEALKLVAKDMPFADYANESYFNRVQAHPTPFIKILEGYINAYWALLRNNYVYFYGKAFYSRITENDAMDYDPSMLSIKDRDRSKDYHILPYSVIFEDERQLSGKDNQLSKQYAKADSGASDFLRLIGQIGQETIYYITTNQYWGTDINRERDLATEIVSMDTSTAVNPYFLMRGLISICEIPFKIARWCHKKKRGGELSRLEEKSLYRRVLSRAMLWRKYWAGKGYVNFKGCIYHSTKDVGKTKGFASKRIDTLNCWIPLKYCYGSVNTFMFYSVQQELLSSSKWKLKDEPNTIKDEDLAKRVLSKRTELIKGKEHKGSTAKGKAEDAPAPASG